MINIYKQKKVVWIDLESPTADEVKEIMEKYNIHPLVAEELLRPTLRPKADIYKDFLYLILHFPTLAPNRKGCASCEVDFILGKNFIITTHYQTVSPLIEMGKIFETDAMLKENHFSKNPGILFFYIVKQLYSMSMEQLDNLQSQIEEIEERMFEKKPSQYDLVRKISHVYKDILYFRRIIQPHKEIFSSFELTAIKFYGKDFQHYLNNLVGEYYKLFNLSENNKDNISSLQATVDSLLSNRTNEIMKILTIMAFVTFPLAVFTSLFGMNTKSMPIVGVKGDFWIILSIMILATIGMFGYFKRKKWI